MSTAAVSRRASWLVVVALIACEQPTSVSAASQDGEVSGALVSAAPSSSLQVSILGPGQIKPNGICTWWSAIGPGGTPPYSYRWLRRSVDTPPKFAQVVSTDSWYTGGAGTDSIFLLSLVVEDANQQRGSDELTVSVSSSAPDCLQ